jgi:hypothetical protein
MLGRVILSWYWQRAKENPQNCRNDPSRVFEPNSQYVYDKVLFVEMKKAWSLLDTLTRSVQIPEGSCRFTGQPRSLAEMSEIDRREKCTPQQGVQSQYCYKPLAIWRFLEFFRSLQLCIKTNYFAGSPEANKVGKISGLTNQFLYDLTFSRQVVLYLPLGLTLNDSTCCKHRFCFVFYSSRN